MAELDFKGRAAANSWKEKAEDLNQRTDAKLKQVAACLQEIKGESVGDMVDQMVEAGAGMLDSGAKMVSAMSQMISMVDKLLAAFVQALADAVSGVSSKKSTITMQ